jgi:hypothetical protein
MNSSGFKSLKADDAYESERNSRHERIRSDATESLRMSSAQVGQRRGPRQKQSVPVSLQVPSQQPTNRTRQIQCGSRYRCCCVFGATRPHRFFSFAKQHNNTKLLTLTRASAHHRDSLIHSALACKACTLSYLLAFINELAEASTRQHPRHTAD